MQHAMQAPISMIIFADIYVAKILGASSIVSEALFTPILFTTTGNILGYVVWTQLKKAKYLIKE